MPAAKLSLSFHSGLAEAKTLLIPVGQDKDSVLLTIATSFLAGRSHAGAQYEFVLQEAEGELVLDPSGFYLALAPYIAAPKATEEIRATLQDAFGPCVTFEISGRAQITAKIRLLERESYAPHCLTPGISSCSHLKSCLLRACRKLDGGLAKVRI